MAAGNPKTEISALEMGMDLRSLDKSTGSSWLQNVIHRNGKYYTRDGFGLVGQYSTRMSTEAQDGTTLGYESVLGSVIAQLDNGHNQIMTVLTATVMTADSGTYTNGSWGVGQFGGIRKVYILSVHDLSSNRQDEFVFAVPTSFTGLNNYQLPRMAPPFQQRYGNSVASWLPVTYEGQVQFVQLADRWVIVIPTVGVWVYRPVDVGVSPLTNTTHVVNGDQIRAVNFRGEFSALQPLLFGNGPGTANYAYISDSEMPKPTCLVLL